MYFVLYFSTTYFLSLEGVHICILLSQEAVTCMLYSLEYIF